MWQYSRPKGFIENLLNGNCVFKQKAWDKTDILVPILAETWAAYQNLHLICYKRREFLKAVKLINITTFEVWTGTLLEIRNKQHRFGPIFLQEKPHQSQLANQPADHAIIYF